MTDMEKLQTLVEKYHKIKIEKHYIDEKKLCLLVNKKVYIGDEGETLKEIISTAYSKEGK